MYDQIFAWIRGVCAIGAGILSYLYGDMNGLLICLFAVIILDYITGLIKAGIQHKLSSTVGFKGILKKMLILLVVAMAHLIDDCVGSGETWRNIAIVFYISNEGLSILENAVSCGLPVPKKLKDILENMEKETEEKQKMLELEKGLKCNVIHGII
mgnify:CR=1 FL=1